MTRTRRLCCTLLTAVVVGLLAPAAPSQADPTPTPQQDRRSDRHVEVTLEEALAQQYAGRRARWSMYLCTGYTGCRQAGYGNAKYRQNNDRMYWLMYSGHNCTNYAAYRMVKAGMSNDRPWSGTGNAYNWGHAKSGITDRKPMVGAVAWWDRNVPGAGSNGHVAYVERVISKTKIIISEDSWSGDFHWRRIRKRDGSWPSGFIHFRDARVRATSKPTIVGTPQVGEPLRVQGARWSTKATLTRQWFADGKPIPGATGARFTPTPVQARHRLSVKVTAKASGYRAGSASTGRTERVHRGRLELVSRPAVLGRPQVGQVLTLDPPSWRPAPASTSLQWYAAGQPIPGATYARFRVRPEQVGEAISVQVKARAAGYHRAKATSERTDPARKGRISVASPFALTGRALVGERLRATPGRLTPANARVSYRWFRNGHLIDGASGSAYDLAPRDLGRTITAHAVLRAAGYHRKTVGLPEAGPVRTRPDLALTVRRKGHRAIVRVVVTAPGASPVRGPVTLTLDDHERSKSLKKGTAKWVVRHLDKGTHGVRVRYAATELVLAGTAAGTVRIPRHH